MSAYTKGAKRRQRQNRPAQVVRTGETEVVRPQTLSTRALIEPENLRWYGLNVQSQMEERMIQVLDLCGIPAAIPTVPKERRRRGKLFRWRSPICGGLIMVGFPGTAPIQWHEVTRFSRVHGFVNYNGRPQQIPWQADYEEDGKVKKGGVQTLLSDLDAVRVGAAKFIRMRPSYKVGDVVRIEDGPFKGHEGKVEHSSDLDVRVLLMMFGRASPMTLSIGDVVRAA